MELFSVKLKQCIIGDIMKNKINTPLLKKRAAMGIYAIVRFIIIFGLGFIILKPIISKLLLSFMSPEDLLDNTVSQVPKNWSLHYWKFAISGLHLSESMVNSLLLSLSIAIIQVAVCTFIGYGIGRIKFKGAKIAFIFVILIMMVPTQTINIAQYLTFVYFKIGPVTFNLSDSFWPLYILSFTGLGIKEGLYIYLLKEQFSAMPKDLEEAAYIDGAGIFSTFFKVMVPNAITTMATVFLFSFCWQWTDTTYSGLYFTNLRVLANSIADVQIKSGLSWDSAGTLIARNAASLVIMLPLVVLFVFCQRFFVQSVSRSGLSN